MAMVFVVVKQIPTIITTQLPQSLPFPALRVTMGIAARFMVRVTTFPNHKLFVQVTPAVPALRKVFQPISMAQHVSIIAAA
jgi:hypothetical protein